MSSNEYAKKESKGSKQVTVKVGMVGDSQVGKSSLMVKYVDGSFDEDYIQTLGMCLLYTVYPFVYTYILIRCKLYG